MGERRLIASARGHRMKCFLPRRMLDPEEFLSDYGVRSMSKFHKDDPYVLTVRGETKRSCATSLPNRRRSDPAVTKLAWTGLDANQLPARRFTGRIFIITTATTFKWNALPVRVSSPP